MCVCVCVYIYIYIKKERKRESLLAILLCHLFQFYLIPMALFFAAIYMYQLLRSGGDANPNSGRILGDFHSNFSLFYSSYRTEG